MKILTILTILIIALSGCASSGPTIGSSASDVYTIRTCPYTPGAAFQDCSCEADEIVISGGTGSAYGIREDIMLDSRRWRVACKSGPSGTHQNCSNVRILCLRQ